MARILVADDDPDIRALLHTALGLAGHEVILAADGREAIDRYHERRPDVVVLDIFMPDKEGLETIMELRQSAPGVRIIAMSGGGRLGNRTFLQQAEKLGATRAIAKPFAPAAMVSLIADVLGRS